MQYLSGILEALKQCGIHTAIQTCGLFDPAAFNQLLLPYLDLIHFDIKLIDQREHEKHTGVGNAVILSNFRALTAIAKDRILPRIPLIPGITMRRDNLAGIAALLKGLGYAVCELLPYNPDGARKRRTLGIPVAPEVMETMPDGATCQALQQEFLRYVQ
jgi:pyruvate formate lyase activating enzyme